MRQFGDGGGLRGGDQEVGTERQCCLTRQPPLAEE